MALGFRCSTDRRGTSGKLVGAERTGRIGFTDQKLYKTDAFLEAHPFGTVPAVFSPDGRTGHFRAKQHYACCCTAWSRTLSGLRSQRIRKFARGAAFLLDSYEGALLRARVERSRKPFDRFMKFAFGQLLI